MLLFGIINMSSLAELEGQTHYILKSKGSLLLSFTDLMKQCYDKDTLVSNYYLVSTLPQNIN